jgi:hypothetical protein
MTTLQKLINGICADIDREAATVRIHNAIQLALQRFKGKRVNKRLEGYILENLGCSCTVVQTEYIAGMTYLRVWGIGPFTAYGNCSRHFLGYAEDMACYDPAVFAERDASNGEAAIRRNDERQALLADPDHLRVLAKAIDKHNEAFRHVQALTDHGIIGHQAHYHALRMLEGTEYHKRAEDEAREARRRG